MYFEVIRQYVTSTSISFIYIYIRSSCRKRPEKTFSVGTPNKLGFFFFRRIFDSYILMKILLLTAAMLRVSSFPAKVVFDTIVFFSYTIKKKHPIKSYPIAIISYRENWKFSFNFLFQLENLCIMKFEFFHGFNL